MTAATSDAPIVGIAGGGVTGTAAGRILSARGCRVAWYDPRPGVAVRAASRSGGVVVGALDELMAADAVVVAAPVPHAPAVSDLLVAGVHVVSCGDDLDDIEAMLPLDAAATGAGRTVVLGAALSPGLSGLLARYLAGQLECAEEVHVATHGTGGPACAVQHHRALGDRAVAWHDGEWVERPGGSGRELCWFPEPVGALDCYRGALAEPVLLRRAMPELLRISARVSATRRDRLTARLPMLTPPRRQGDLGACRVEVRGRAADGQRITHIAGAAGRTGVIAGTVAALFAVACVERRTPPGLVLPGDDANLSSWLLAEAGAAGVALHEYTGVARSTNW